MNKKAGRSKISHISILFLSFSFCFTSFIHAQTADSTKTLFVPELHWTLHYPTTIDAIAVRDMQAQMNETKQQYFKNDSLINLNAITTLLTLKTTTGGILHSTLQLMKNTNQPSAADFLRVKTALVDLYKSSGTSTVEITKQTIDNNVFYFIKLSVIPNDGSPAFYEENYSLLKGKYHLSVAMRYTDTADAQLFHKLLFTSSFH